MKTVFKSFQGLRAPSTLAALLWLAWRPVRGFDSPTGKGVIGMVEARDAETGELVWQRPTIEGNNLHGVTPRLSAPAPRETESGRSPLHEAR